jgi:hypothetical protein
MRIRDRVVQGEQPQNRLSCGGDSRVGNTDQRGLHPQLASQSRRKGQAPPRMTMLVMASRTLRLALARPAPNMVKTQTKMLVYRYFCNFCQFT